MWRSMCVWKTWFDQNFIITNDYNFGPRQARGLGVFGGVTVEF